MISSSLSVRVVVEASKTISSGEVPTLSGNIVSFQTISSCVILIGNSRTVVACVMGFVAVMVILVLVELVNVIS